ncbi:hypothetical protein RZS08_06545 [Arthrospira platensis SPKY1]|nr:hypothetical protein [Arthrospira platensis SPKY1]
MRPHVRQAYTHRQVSGEKKRTLRRIGDQLVLNALPAGEKVAAKANALFGGRIHVHGLELLPRFAQAHELRVEVECPGRFFRIPRQFPEHNRLRQARLTRARRGFDRGDGHFDRRDGRFHPLRRGIFLFDLRFRPLIQRQLERRRGHSALNRTAQRRTDRGHLRFAPQIVKGRLRFPAEFPVQPLHDRCCLLPEEVTREEGTNRTNRAGVVAPQHLQQRRESKPFRQILREPVHRRMPCRGPWRRARFSLFIVLSQRLPPGH